VGGRVTPRGGDKASAVPKRAFKESMEGPSNC